GSTELWRPADPAFRADPYPYYAELRTTDPVHRLDPYTVVVTRHSDVASTLRGPEFARDIERHSAAPADDPVSRRRQERASSGARSILNLDPPDHTRLRRLVTQAFTPRAVERLRSITAEMVDEVLDTAERDGGLELIDQLAFPIPFRVISALLDMPTDRSDELREWSQILTATLEPTAMSSVSLVVSPETSPPTGPHPDDSTMGVSGESGAESMVQNEPVPESSRSGSTCSRGKAMSGS
ncbi:MAG: hypothetical protein ACPHJ1_10070, partial [Ilumatobacteraceae bacterium]